MVIMDNNSAYDNCLKDMFGLRRFGIKLGLDTILNILEGLGNPHRKFISIHIAGTNGKGSIASYLTSILFRSGYKVGLYTSPHLVKFNERICIDQKPITDQEVLEAYQAVKSSHYGDREPTFFEFSTAMAFYAFGKHNVDFAIIETGMGGRLDATNVVMPAISIISNISLEHQSYLGDTLVQIAGEKAGIIKQRVPVVTGVTQDEVIDVIEKTASKLSAPCYRLSDHFSIEIKADHGFDYNGIYQMYTNLKTGLAGDFQPLNAALALAACEILSRDSDVNISEQTLRQGLLHTHWPGRLEVLPTSPKIILDGAHNLAAAQNLARYLTQTYPQKVILVIGILDDKPYEQMLQLLLPCAKRVILTQPKIDRRLDTNHLKMVAQKMVSDITTISDVDKAVFHAMESSDKNDIICVAGSLYVVGEAKQALEDPSMELQHV